MKRIPFPLPVVVSADTPPVIDAWGMFYCIWETPKVGDAVMVFGYSMRITVVIRDCDAGTTTIGYRWAGAKPQYLPDGDDPIWLF